MFKKFLPNIYDIDEKIKKIMKIGLFISVSLAVLSSLILFTYLTFLKTLTTYYLGLMILKLGVILATGFIVAGLSTDRIQKELFR